MTSIELIDNFESDYPMLVQLIKEEKYLELRNIYCDFLIELLKKNFIKPTTDDALRGVATYFRFTKYVDKNYSELKALKVEKQLISYFDIAFNYGFWHCWAELNEYFDTDFTSYVEPEALLVILYELKENGESKTSDEISWIEHDSNKFTDADIFETYLENPKFDAQLKKYNIPFDKEKIISLKIAHDQKHPQPKGLFQRFKEFIRNK
jgi:hypothetical protein